ncbi:hypothetical protein HK098_007660 [Nowakowskiella sp. JEL0407]|nr:hypothetical protein HK098_007660 [Nowakowskiella sp. JEL0407]
MTNTTLNVDKRSKEVTILKLQVPEGSAESLSEGKGRNSGSVPTRPNKITLFTAFCGEYTSIDGKFTTKLYTCRLKKPRSSSTRADEVETSRRITSARQPDQCSAAMKVFSCSDYVVLIPHSENFQSHSIETSDHVKIPTSLHELVEVEASKPYRPPNIVQALRKMNENSEIGAFTPLLTSQYVRNNV